MEVMEVDMMALNHGSPVNEFENEPILPQGLKRIGGIDPPYPPRTRTSPPGVFLASSKCTLSACQSSWPLSNSNWHENRPSFPQQMAVFSGLLGAREKTMGPWNRLDLKIELR